ncbi:DNA polymerase III subunit [Sphingobacterium lumbrici]|uniref:DNA polymerase III subunit n=1 Tax=Sphingobacterium lumbrici TaxID=2559600 RepID=UPI0011275469|nr:DNA polymerase III subunit delta' [Sphingobacterium lumbrici]
MRFKEIIGHEIIKAHLLNTVKENRVSHAQLFLGPEGSGSLALAVAYAQYVNCEDKGEDDSCGQCPSCRKYEKLIHPDLHFSYPFFAKGKDETATTYIENWRKSFIANPYMGLSFWRDQLDAENKQANINIAEAHSIIKKLSLKSFEAEYKVLIMWLPEYLDTQGNALLKLIEEPPEKTLFLLVAENQDKIINTIISRTQLVKINKLQHDKIKNFLIENKNLDPKNANEIAFIADGNIQEALNLTQQENENKTFDLFVYWLRNIYSDAGSEIINLCDENLAKLGRENQKSFLLYAINMMRQIILTQQGLHDLVFLQQEELTFVEKFSGIYQFEQLEEAIGLLEKAHYAIERNANPKILFLDLSLQLVLLFKLR